MLTKKGTELLYRERDRESRASEPRSLVALRALLWKSLSECERLELDLKFNCLRKNNKGGSMLVLVVFMGLFYDFVLG